MKLVTCLLVQELAEKESEDGVFKMLSIDVTRFLTTVLIGATVVNIGATALVTKAATSIFGEAGVSAATGVMTVAVLLLTEITPKSIAVHNATEVARFVVRPVPWISLNIISCGKSCYVSIKSEALTSQAHRQLYGLCFLGKVLSVERANNPTENNKNQQGAGQSGKHSSSLTKDSTPNRELNEGSKLGSFSASEPIAERLGVDYPFPPHLEYAYPPPDGNILTNIVNALIAVPRFYTQVLHLMNKMNIPAPFRMALPTPPLPTSVVVPTPPPPPPLPPPIATKPPTADLSSGESELESSDEEVDGKAHPIGVPRVARPKRKRIKREAIVGPAVDKYVAHEAVGLKPANLVPKEIPMIKKKNPVLQIKIMPKQVQSEQTEIDMEKESMEPDKENLDFRPYATPEELKSGKLPPEEILSLPMFKNYMAGNPASVLYVKNLAKDVVVDDFYFIFGSLFESIDAAKSSLSVKLMQEGRMRGQAFVTFPSIELAHHALNLVNGYMFKGKPMIIQFGRNTTTTAKTN